MKVVDSLPCPVRDIENCWIPLSGGQRLAARLWLPRDAASRPVPAIVEYLPYRKRDGTRWRDEPMHRYFAGHGYAAVRIDLRGTGDSDGVLHDEYLPQEQQDAVEALRWIADQPWCDGNVGMMGKSWGGFNSLQIASLRPPELKAIITVCSTDDRYSDDAHYMGGCLLIENVNWGANFFALSALPPDPDLVGPGWKDVWQTRLDHLRPFPAPWLEHPHRDRYWQQGSVGEAFERIACPVYAVSGWADGYSNAVPRLVNGLHVPCKGLIGPWGHLYPHDGRPGPAIGFLQEALRWWDTWLKGLETHIADDPRLQVWIQDGRFGGSTEPDRVRGRWVAESGWPPASIGWARYRLRPSRLEPETGAADRPTTEIVFCSPQNVGQDAGCWCSFGERDELPGDQRMDDSRSQTFDSDPLDRALDLLGAPVASLDVAADRPAALVCVRLCAVAPDGRSTRITYGLLNLTHRNGHECPERLEPGRRYTVSVAMNDVGYSIPAGYRLRLALSTTYWPIVWPSPEVVTLTLFPESSSLAIPVRPPGDGAQRVRQFAGPEGAKPLDAVDLHPERYIRRSWHDGDSNTSFQTARLNLTDDGQPVLSRIRAINLEVGHGIEERFSIEADDPLSARAEIRHRAAWRRGDWRVRIETRTAFRATRDAFQLEAELRAFEAGELVFTRDWRESIERDGV